MARTHNKTKSKKAIVLKSIVSVKIFWVIMVPGGGFEPPTRGFSVHCSTPELPGQGKAICFRWDSTRVSSSYCPEGFWVNFWDRKLNFQPSFFEKA